MRGSNLFDSKTNQPFFELVCPEQACFIHHFSLIVPLYMAAAHLKVESGLTEVGINHKQQCQRHGRHSIRENLQRDVRGVIQTFFRPDNEKCAMSSNRSLMKPHFTGASSMFSSGCSCQSARYGIA